MTDRRTGVIGADGNAEVLPGKAIAVYVREGDHEGERTLAFHPPSEIPQHDLLTLGFAIDGNSAIAGITKNTYAFDGPQLENQGFEERIDRAAEEGRTLTQALRDAQLWLVNWLSSLGYDVQFK